MNERGNITLNQRAFNRLVVYLKINNYNDILQWLEENSLKNNLCFKADYDEQGEISIILTYKNNPTILDQIVVPYDASIETSKIQDTLFHSEQRVEDWE